jgi:hypothetical protein
MTKIQNFAVITLILLTAFFSFAQSNPFWVYGGASIPIGEFGATKGLGAGGAQAGYVIGLDIYSFGQGGGSWFGVSYCMNGFGLRSDIKNLYSTYSIVVKHGSWRNLPIIYGYRFASRPSSSPSIYGELLSGIDLIIAPNFKLSRNGEIAELRWKTGYANLVGGGFGIIANNKFQVGFRYIQSVDFIFPPEINGKRKVGSVETSVSFNQSISIATLVVGYNF